MMDKEDLRAYEEALIAIDGSVNVLVMARMLLEKRYDEARGVEPEAKTKPAPAAPMGSKAADRGTCPHEELMAVPNRGVSICLKCGENIEASGE